MKNRTVHVARDGKVIGQYPPMQLVSLLDTGGILPTDLCYSELLPAWTPVLEFIEKTGVEKFSRASAPSEEGSVEKAPSRAPSSNRRQSRKRNNAKNTLIGGWMAFLLAAAALVGSIFWILSQQTEITARDAEIVRLRDEVGKKEKENQRLLFVSRELAEPGTVRGSLVMRNEAGKRIAIPGTEVRMFRRDVIEAHLDTRFTEAAGLPADQQRDAAQFLLLGLSAPLASTTTDASGRFEFPVPEPGEYVLISQIAAPTPRLWFVSFDSRDPLNTLVEISEANAVQQLVRSLMIVQGR